MDAHLEAARITWDVLVIGAGPAGAMAARMLSIAGLKTLLVDAKQFPRTKVCGGYLNNRALESLRCAGMFHLVPDECESRVTQLELIRGRHRTCFALPAGRVISRSTFDTALLESAMNAGATVLTGAQATVDSLIQNSLRSITIVHNGDAITIRAHVIICADGISRTSLRHLPEFVASIAPDSRIGIGAVVTGDFDACPFGQITMVLSRSGYVGISRIGKHLFNVAAAVDRSAVNRTTPAGVVAELLGHSDVSFPPSLLDAQWRGTPSLTSRPACVAANRVLLIGDSGGYIEPFTGEGMATALEAAVAVTPLVVRAARSWSSSIANDWEELHGQLVRDRQRICRQLAWVLRRPWAVFAAFNVCRAMPAIAARLINDTSYSKNVCTQAG